VGRTGKTVFVADLGLFLPSLESLLGREALGLNIFFCCEKHVRHHMFIIFNPKILSE
jgi:hypothetical protein